MPEWDRWWPLGITVGLALIGTAGLLGLWYLASLFALPTLLGLPPLVTLRSYGGLYIFYGVFGGMWLRSIGRQARRRLQARRLALRGDLSAMPLALLSADALKAPEAADLPFEFAWRRQLKGREWGPTLLLALVLSAAPAASFVAAFVLPGDPRRILLPSNLSYLADALAVLTLVLGEALLAVLAWVAFTQEAFARRGPAYAVRADREGIRTVYLLGDGPVVPWAAVRLLEVSEYVGQGSGRVFSLYANGTTIWWLDAEKANHKNPATENDRREFQQRLLALIAARTGMQVRTCTPALMCEVPAAQRSLRYRLLMVGLEHGIPSVLFLLALAALALPLTPFVVLNVYAAMTYAVLGAAAVLTIRKLRESPRTASYTLPGAPALPEEPVEIAFRRRRFGQLSDVFIGVLLLPNFVMLFVAASSPPSSPLRAFGVKVDASVLLLIAFIGAAAIIDGLRSKRTRLHIDGAGLSTSRRRKITRLAWKDIVRLSVDMDGSVAASFTALGADGETISRPARDVVWQPEGGDGPPIMPEELAAIVAQRSGVRLTIE